MLPALSQRVNERAMRNNLSLFASCTRRPSALPCVVAGLQAGQREPVSRTRTNPGLEFPPRESPRLRVGGAGPSRTRDDATEQSGL